MPSTKPKPLALLLLLLLLVLEEEAGPLRLGKWEARRRSSCVRCGSRFGIDWWCTGIGANSTVAEITLY